jgi:hypothetical protein
MPVALVIVALTAVLRLTLNVGVAQLWYANRNSQRKFSYDLS